MKEYGKTPTILIAEDDPDDRLLIQEALEENGVNKKLFFVENGEELMNYLLKEGNYSKNNDLSTPALILLDLNMPKKDGREALKEIKKFPALRQIPIIVLTTSKTDEDIHFTYDSGGNSFITKPASYETLVSIMKILSEFWFSVVELPPTRNLGS